MYDIVLTADRTLMSDNNKNVFLGFAACAPKFVPGWLYNKIFCPPIEEENGKVKFVEPHTINGECWLRRNPLARKMVLNDEQTTCFSENKFACLNHQDKQWFEQTISKEQRTYVMFDALVTNDLKIIKKHLESAYQMDK